MRIFYVTLICILISFELFSGCWEPCCQSFEVGCGWRRDKLDWDLSDLSESCIDAIVDSHMWFKQVEYYTIHGRMKWVGSAFYIKASADYGLSIKGRCQEKFKLDSTLLSCPEVIHVSNHIDRGCEVYDFMGATGYPYVFMDCRAYAVPLIGFTFHRQKLKVHEKNHHHSSSSFCVSSSNPFGISSSSSNPFSSCSDSNTIASELGLSCNHHHHSNYRFTWYGFFLGLDLAYALDPCWTLFSELEIHAYNRCHRKRDSNTGISFVDSYHHDGWCSGFNGRVGTTFYLSPCWYATAGVDYKYWVADQHHDSLEWKSAGINLALVLEF